MALDLNNKNQIREFTQQQLQKGRSLEEINNFIQQKQAQLTQQTRADRAPISTAAGEGIQNLLGDNALSRFLGGATQTVGSLAELPTRQALGNLFTLGQLLSLESQRVSGSPNRELEEKIRTGQNPFLPQEAAQKIVQPTGNMGETLQALEPTLRAGAAGSSFAPGLGALPGALAGFLSTASQARATPLEIGGGVVGGGVTGGLLAKLLGTGASTLVDTPGGAVGREVTETTVKPAGFLGTLGKDIRQQVGGLTRAADDSVFFTSNLNKLDEVFSKLKGSNKAKLAQSEDIFTSLSKDIKEILSKDKSSINLDEVTSALDEAFLGVDLDDAGAKNALQRIFKKLDDASTNNQISREKLFDVLQDVGEQSKKAFKAERSPTAVFTPKDELQTKAYRSIKELINEGAPEQIRNLTEEQSALIDISRQLAKKAESIPLGVKGFEINVPGAARPVQSLLDLLGRGLEGAGDVSVTAQSGAARNALSGILEGGRKAAVKLQTIAPVVGASIVSGKFVPSTVPVSSDVVNILPESDSKGLKENELAALMILDPANADTYKQLYSLTNPDKNITGTDSERKLTEFQRKVEGAADNAQDALAILRSGKVNTGPLAGRLSGITAPIGLEKKELTEFKSKVAISRTAARNALLGANMSDKEIESLLDFTFDTNLPENVLEQRIVSFIDSMGKLSEPNIQ